jgi:hypothetical protein
MNELDPLIAALPDLHLEKFAFVSIHAPSRFDRQSEHRVVEMISTQEACKYPVVVHPDVIFTPSLWRSLDTRLLIENMDKRKPVGRTVLELRSLFELLPDAKFCFDIGHARQVDPSRHDPISRNATRAFQRVARYIPQDTPVILEPLIDEGQSELNVELERAARP